MNKLQVNIAVDDIRPEQGGGIITDPAFEMMHQLNTDFGIKFTLFVVPYWHGQVRIQDHPDVVKAWLDTGYIEIAAHGLEHFGNSKGHEWIEFEHLSIDEAEEKIITSLELFILAGAPKPIGWRFPGWVSNPALAPLIDKYFGYVAAHSNYPHDFQIKKFLYPVGIHEANLSHVRDSRLLLTSHIDGAPITENTWTPANYVRLVMLFQQLGKDWQLEGGYLKDIAGD